MEHYFLSNPRTYIYTHTHTYIHDGWQDGDAVSEDIQAVLYKIVTTADQSANMRKDLKKTFFQTVSNLRNLFTGLMGIIDEKTGLVIRNDTENKVKAEIAACRREVAKAHTETSNVREEPPGHGSRQVLPSHDCAPKLYSTIEHRKKAVYRSGRKPTNTPILSRRY